MRKIMTDCQVKQNGTVEWKFGGTVVNPNLKTVTGTLFDKRRAMVFLLIGRSFSNTILVGLDGEGQERFRVKSPPGYTFSHLTWHVSGQPAVVCGTVEVVAGFMDWHFLIDPKTGDLTKSDPSY